MGEPTNDRLVEALRVAAKEIQRLRNEAAQRAGSPPELDEPIAIVGMACRYPGGVASPDDLWDLLIDERDGVGGYSGDRGWGPDDSFRAGFLDDVAGFDADFFALQPDEAAATDPQHRLLLECAWEVFERAGIKPADLRGTKTAVLAGLMYSDYATWAAEDTGGERAYLQIGVPSSMAPRRVSHFFGLEGPAITVDTACSSAMVSLHLAINALRRHEYDLALVGGVTVMTTPAILHEYVRLGLLPADGRVKPFAAGSRGTGLGEGAGVLLVERLSDAQRHGRRIEAVVRGTAVNQDGAGVDLITPNGQAEQQVILDALAAAGLGADEVDLVEAGSTGVGIGGLVELEALAASYGKQRTAPLWLGSIKSNLSHTQAASAAAGMIKVIMALRHSTMPASLHVTEPTPDLDWPSSGLSVLNRPRAWPATPGRPRRAGVSSFGISGTNAHVILEEPPGSNDEAPEVSRTTVPWVVSGRDVVALRAQAEKLARHVAARPHLRPVDVALSLATTRLTFACSAAVIGRSRDELVVGLEAVAEDQPSPDVERGQGSGLLALCFADLDRSDPGSGDELRAAFPIFATAWDDVTAQLAAVTAAPTMVPFAIALTSLLSSWGVEPTGVMGWSPAGEVVAAHLTGALTLAEACEQIVKGAAEPSESGGIGLSLQVGADDSAVEVAGTPPLAVFGPGRSGVAEVTRALARLHLAGVDVDWEAFFAGSGARTVELPTYAFQHRRYWLDRAAP